VSATFLIRRGKRAVNRKARAHLARYDQRGQVVGAMCGVGYDISSNVPWGLKVCANCRREWEKA
jgi:hypothetical protein